MKLENQTAFLPAATVILDKDAAEHLVLALKATYDIGPTGTLQIGKKQDPFRPADEFNGEPGKSSIRYAAELGPPKVVTDVALIGSAVATRPGLTNADVGLRVGPVSKWVKVFGERRWKKGLLGISPTSAEPFDRVRLTYENAYGGEDKSSKNQKHHAREPRNPVGRGFKAKGSDIEWAGELAPNIEDPKNLLSHPGDKVVPQGFGFIGRDWEPRGSYCGTYDEKWQAERMPLLPLDFDERFHNAGQPDLLPPSGLKGGEPVEVIGCSASGRLLFALPAWRPAVMVSGRALAETAEMIMDTVVIDTDALKLFLIWKADVKIHRRLMDVRRIDFRMRS